MPPSLDDLEKSILVVFHYGVSHETTDLLVDENDPIIDALVQEGFQTSKSRHSKRLNIYLKSEKDLYRASQITDYPHFLSLKK